MSNPEKSCGAVVFVIQDEEIYYLLIKSSDNVIGFPKGHMKPGESEKETALREIFEETSLNVKLFDPFREVIRYDLPNGNTKEVVYFLAEYQNQVPMYNDCFEYNEYFILKYYDAMKLLSYDNSRNIIKRANKYIKNLNN